MGDFLVKFINLLIESFAQTITFLFSVLPDSPFGSIADQIRNNIEANAVVADILGIFNYFFPLIEIINVFKVWLPAVGLYYIYMVVMRWVKIIE